MLKPIMEQDLSVRAVEKMVNQRPGEAPASKKSPSRAPYMDELEQKLMDKLGVKVELKPDAIVIPYGSNDQLTLILRRLGVAL